MEIRAKQKFAFGFGAVGKDIVYMFVAGYLLYYYNVVLGMDSAFIGIVLMAARVFDAFNDPIMGIVVAKTRTKWGRFRPWILAGTVMNAVTIFALFSAPKAGDGVLRIWLIIFYLAWGVTYTLMDIPFWSMIPAITRPGKDREELSSLARSCSGVGDAIPTVLTMVIVPVLGAGTAIANMRTGFMFWAIIISVIFVISEIVCVLNVKEPVNTYKKDEKAPGVGAMFKALFKNDQAMTIVVSIILVYTALNMVANLILYFFTYDVGDANTAYSLFTGAAFLAQVVAMLLIPLFRKKFSKKQLFLTGFVVQIAGFLLILLLTFTGIYTPASWMILLLPGIMIYAGYGVLNVIMTIFLSDSVDYGEVKNGTREESVIFSMQTFTVKLASGIAVFVAGIVLDLIHLDTTAAAQSTETLSSLRIWMTFPSFILLIIGIFVYLKFYKLDEKKMDEISETLQKKGLPEDL